VANYTHPVQRNLNSVSGQLSISTYTKNNLLINPVTISTSDNWVFNFYNDITSFFFFQNEKKSEARSDSNLLSFFIYPKNQGSFYKRDYMKIQNILANVGGFINFIWTISIWINYYFNKYKTIVNILENLKRNNF